MMVNSPRLVIFMAVLLLHTACAVAARCPDCGRTPVPYPFSTGPSCGNQLYKIRCDMNVLKFDTINNTYPVLSISPENQRLVIGQSHFLPNTCVSADLATNGIQLNTSLPFTITASNTVFYFNCSDAMLAVALDCTPTNPCHIYQNGSAQMSTCRRVPHCCSYKIGSSTNQYFLRLMVERCSAYTSFVNLNISSPVTRWPDPAVELTWAPPPEPPCATQAQCDSTSTCRNTQDGGNGRTCFCNRKFRWDPIAGRCSSGN